MPRAVQLMVFALVVTGQSLPGAQPPRQAPRARTAAAHPPVATADGPACTTCHGDVVDRRVMHGPTAAGKCSTCHTVGTVAGRFSVILTNGAATGDTAALCMTCHADITDRLTRRHRHAPVAAGNCTACHDPHGSSFRYFLPAEGNRACTRCHDDIAQALEQKHAHAPAAASCQICHDPHAASGPTQLRAPGNTICLACHFDGPVDAAAADDGAPFGRHPPAGLEPLVAGGGRIRLDSSLASGHPTIAHPVAARRDPRAKDRTLGCTSCHNPHGSPSANLFRFGAKNVSALCVQCHDF